MSSDSIISLGICCSFLSLALLKVRDNEDKLQNMINLFNFGVISSFTNEIKELMNDFNLLSILSFFIIV